MASSTDDRPSMAEQTRRVVVLHLYDRDASEVGTLTRRIGTPM